MQRRTIRNSLALVVASASAAAAAVLVTAMIPAVANATGPSHHVVMNDNSQGEDQGNGPQLDRVFIIMLENHGLNDVIGDPAAPTITNLANTYALATQYYGVTHPSEPNYIAATSGSNWFINNDSPANVYNHTNIVDDLNLQHISWDAYMQAMPSVGFTGASWPSNSNALYASKHNPFVLYGDILGNPAELDHVKPYTSLAADLTNPGTAPRYVWISPDECDNMHGGIFTAVPGFSDTPCPFSNAPGDANDEALKADADNFVATTVHTIMTSRAWTPHSAIFIVADEGDFTGVAQNGGWDSPAGCCDSPVLPKGDPDINALWPGGLYGGALVPAIVIDPSGPHAYVNDVAFNHYSLLRTIEDAWNLPELGFTSDHAQVATMNAFLGSGD